MFAPGSAARYATETDATWLDDREGTNQTSSERLYHGEIAALVGEEAHVSVQSRGRSRTCEDDLFVRDPLRGIADRGLQVVARQPGVGIEKIRFRGTVAELSQQEIHGDSGSADDGLAEQCGLISMRSVVMSAFRGGGDNCALAFWHIGLLRWSRT